MDGASILFGPLRTMNPNPALFLTLISRFVKKSASGEEGNQIINFKNSSNLTENGKIFYNCAFDDDF